MANVGIIYGSNKGDAKDVAEFVGANFDAEIIDAQNLAADFFTRFTRFIFVASTHAYGELQKDFKAKLNLVAEADFKGKTIALVGVGNQERHPETFNDGLVEFLPLIRGAKLVGSSEVGNYTNFTNSLSLINGKFVGLVVDYKGDENWKERANAWVTALKPVF